MKILYTIHKMKTTIKVTISNFIAVLNKILLKKKISNFKSGYYL